MPRKRDEREYMAVVVEEITKKTEKAVLLEIEYTLDDETLSMCGQSIWVPLSVIEEEDDEIYEPIPPAQLELNHCNVVASGEWVV